MGVGDNFHFWLYSSDDGTNYAIKLSDVVAAQGTFTGPVDPRAHPGYPYGVKNLRHVYGKSVTGTKTKLPCATASMSLFVTGGTFVTKAGSFTVEGSIGEKRKISARI
jgi:hypothetical protein